MEVTRPVSFLVQLPDDHLVRRHQDQLRNRKNNSEESSTTELEPIGSEPDFLPEIPLGNSEADPPPVTGSPGTADPRTTDPTPESSLPQTQESETLISESPPMPELTPVRKTYLRRKPKWFDGPRT